jgi:hypothetical protein
MDKVKLINTKRIKISHSSNLSLRVTGQSWWPLLYQTGANSMRIKVSLRKLKDFLILEDHFLQCSQKEQVEWHCRQSKTMLLCPIINITKSQWGPKAQATQPEQMKVAWGKWIPDMAQKGGEEAKKEIGNIGWGTF